MNRLAVFKESTTTNGRVKIVKYSANGLDYPIASENLQIEESGTDVIAFDSTNESFHLLNATAHSIIKLCDGSNTVKDITLALSRQFDFPDLETIASDVEQTIDIFRQSRLVAVIAPDSELRKTGSTEMNDSSLFALSLVGNSMFPVLLPTDKVLVKRCTLDELRPGDIVVWCDAETFVAHRILSIDAASDPPVVKTKGDSSPDADPAVRIDRVVGKVIAVMRGGGVRWMRALDSGQKELLNRDKEAGLARRRAAVGPDLRRPCYARMQVLDLREISIEAIRNIERVEQISLVLLSHRNAPVWPEVEAREVKSVVTAPDNYRVYTGQPELLPEIVEFLPSPLKLIVSGQIFLTAFTSDEIRAVFGALILHGQAYVSSVEAKTALESVTTIVKGSVCILPHEHVRWIGAAIVGPEYSMKNQDLPLIAIGDLTVSTRLDSIPSSVSQFNRIAVQAKELAVIG